MYLGKSKWFKILVGSLLLSISASGQTGNSIRYRFNDTLQEKNVITGSRSIIINYTLSELNIERISIDQGFFYRLRMPGHSLTAVPGKPEVPVLNRLINIPEGTSFNIRISDVRSVTIYPSAEKVKGLLFPAQHGETKQKDTRKSGFVIDKEIYSRKGLIDSDTVAIESLGKSRNNNLFNVVISPVRYNPVSNFLEVITSMKIEIQFSNDGIYASKSSSSESFLFNETLEKGILNYYPADLITGYSDQPVEMIILTDTTFKKYLEPFFTWKRQKGYKLHILYRGKDLAGTSYQELKESIAKIYSSSSAAGHPPEYLLIVGDESKIPYYGSGNVTDLYFAEFDGNGDYLPDMYIGRIPAPDTGSVKSVVQKILEYEKFRFDGANKFYTKALALAGKDATYANHMNGQVKYGITNYLTPANGISEYHFYYPEGSTKKDSVLKLVSKGLSFINYTGHGSSAGWLHIDIKSQDIINFNNRSMYPFVISNACRTAQFNDTASFGNKMVLAAGEGAIGFIGCTNDSYWDEDFAWAVGSGMPNPDPKYTDTGLGAYDRLFHTHNELPSEWYYSMGQVNYAGNLAVSSTASQRKKYYWETYEVLGDPSIVPILGTPKPFSFSLPDTLPNGIKSVSFTIDPFAYIAVSHFDTLWDASFASPSGSVVLDLPGLTNDSCLVVVTGQNRIPIVKTIFFSDIQKEFINLSGTAINDTNANGNGKADFGETFYLNLKISNLGLTSASNLSASVSSVSPWVKIVNSSALIGTLAARSEINIDDVLQITISENIPDLGIITVDLILKDARIEKKYKIDITIHAPDLEIINCLIDDSEYGNNNYIADPGENFDLVFQVRNDGSSNTSGQFLVHSQESDLDIADSNIKSGLLQFGKVSSIHVSVKLSEYAQYGEYIPLSSILDCTPYIISRDFTIRVGKVRESFESSTFTVFPWINLSAKPWIITESNSIDGNLSARSGAIGHNTLSSLIMRTYFQGPDTLKFYYKVSSEPEYDYLLFKLNGTEIMKKSGEIPWEKKIIPVLPGLNKFEWIYKKDNTVNQGADGAWIDLIDFTGTTDVNYIKRDIEVARIVTPYQKSSYGRELVSAKILNVGSDTLTGLNLAYSLNGRPPVIQYFKTKLTPYQDSVTLSFDKRAEMGMSGKYEIVVYSFENSDDFLLNDTLMAQMENTSLDEYIAVYPNPFTDQLNISINSDTERKVRISLTNVSGKLVNSEDYYLTVGENQIIINTSNLSPALYLMNITGSGLSRVYSLIKVKR